MSLKLRFLVNLLSLNPLTHFSIEIQEGKCGLNTHLLLKEDYKYLNVWIFMLLKLCNCSCSNLMKSLWCLISRYLVVCHAAALVGREKNVRQHILRLTINVPIGIGIASWLYRENVHIFLNCMGKMELFMFNLDNPFQPFVGGWLIKLSLLNPFRFCVNAVSFSFTVVVPILYFNIFKFRLYQDANAPGKNKHN